MLLDDLFLSGLLRTASKSGNSDIVKELLAIGVDPNQPIIIQGLEDGKITKQFTTYYLHDTSKRGYLEVVKVLLDDKRIKINEKDSDGKTALDYAKKNDDENYNKIAALIEAALLTTTLSTLHSQRFLLLLL